MNQIYARCPVCAEPLPVFTVHVVRRGTFRRQFELVITEDATDFVAHMWAHEQKGVTT